MNDTVTVPRDLVERMLEAVSALWVLQYGKGHEAEAMETKVLEIDLRALLSRPAAQTEKQWCSCCGKHTDHSSGACPQILLAERARELEAAIRKHRDSCNTAATVAIEDQAHENLWSHLEGSPQPGGAE